MAVSIFSKLARYIVIGLSAAALDFSVFIFLIKITESSLLVANTLAILVGFFWSFILNKLWAFNSIRAPGFQLFLTFLLLLFNILVTSLLIDFLVEEFQWPISWAKILVQTSVVFWNFIIYNYFIFKN
jgi:putative flippase GtrA